jgi:protein-S-isoprenylcysteine O-methyltransferase Ste14
VSVVITGIEIEFNENLAEYKPGELLTLDPGETLQHSFSLTLPALPGSLPLRVTAFYRNEGKDFSLNTIGYFHHIEERIYAGGISIRADRIEHEGWVRLVGKTASQWRLVLPQELEVVTEDNTSSEKKIHVRANRKGFVTSYPIYAITTVTDGERNYSKIISSTITVDDSSGYTRGRLGNSFLLFLLALSLAAFTWAWAHRARSDHHHVSALGKYAARVAWLSIAYLILKNAASACQVLGAFTDDFVFLRFQQENTYIFSSFAGRNLVADFFFLLADNFRGENYKHFFVWFIDTYFVLTILVSFLYLFFSDRTSCLAADKYAACLGRILFPWIDLRKDASQANLVAERAGISLAKLGFLTLGVKIFFIPYLISWSIQNANHQWHLTRNLEFTFQSINSYLLSLFLLIDAAIFAFGYLIESRRLNSEIRSVEPSLLGWLVCLWCYPPFNTFSFAMFDYSIYPIHIEVPAWLEPFFYALITASWGIFAWASISLGFKASNLTNRGIVFHGPYRFCRHPAYASKMLLWSIESVVFGRHFIGLLFGFILIYFLRAWTEERHLLNDPDYLRYKNKVKNFFIPGVL